MQRFIDADELLQRIRNSLKDTTQTEIALDWLVTTIKKIQTENHPVLAQMEQMREANKECGRLMEKYQNENIVLKECIVGMCIERVLRNGK